MTKEAGIRQQESEIHDVAVIGGGVVGCAVLRELTRYHLKVILVEKNSDVGEGISKANSGVIHAGFNVPTGSLKAQLNVAGLGQIYPLAAQLSVPVRRTGKLVVAFEDADRERLEDLKDQGDRNGTPSLEIVDAAAITELEPLSRGKWALWSPNTGIISPFLFTIALAESAQLNAAEFLFDAPVSGAERVSDRNFVIHTARGILRSRWVINCAGTFSAELAGMICKLPYRIYPYRGEYHVTDKDEILGLKMPIYPLPPLDGRDLGIHITPTIEGNILLGPSSNFIPDRDDTSTTQSISEQLRKEAYRLMPELKKLPFIRSFAGIRPKLVDPRGNGPLFHDFVIRQEKEAPGWINCIGIESPGLSSAPAIAQYVAAMIVEAEHPAERTDFIPGLAERKVFADMNHKERREAVAADGRWSEMVCRCETVTRMEVERAMENIIGPVTLDALKRRVRCGSGRCQGSFCMPRIIDILRERNYDVSKLTKRGSNSELFYGLVKEP